MELHNAYQQLNVSGVSTFQSHVHLGDNDELRFVIVMISRSTTNLTFNNTVIRESGAGVLLFGGRN